MIETRLRARLFGLPALRVDGTVLVSPGKLVDPVAAIPGTTVSAPVTTASSPRTRREPDRSSGGQELARAAQLLATNGAALERSRRD